jgi:hypothetical protein
MNYITWLNIKATLIDIFTFILNVFKWILFAVLMMFRFIIYVASSFAFAILSIAFPFGTYFCVTVVKELMNGVPIMETSNFGFFLLFFVVPIGLAIVREIAKP